MQFNRDLQELSKGCNISFVCFPWCLAIKYFMNNFNKELCEMKKFHTLYRFGLSSNSLVLSIYQFILNLCHKLCHKGLPKTEELKNLCAPISAWSGGNSTKSPSTAGRIALQFCTQEGRTMFRLIGAYAVVLMCPGSAILFFFCF